jgi:hypothetical protein
VEEFRLGSNWTLAFIQKELEHRAAAAKHVLCGGCKGCRRYLSRAVRSITKRQQ